MWMFADNLLNYLYESLLSACKLSLWRFAVSLLNLFYQPVKLVLCEGFLTACKLSGIGHLNSHTMHRLERERGYANNLDAQIHPDTHILTVKKLWLVLTQQSIHDKVSTYYCLKMCWVTVRQWRRCQMRQTFPQIHPVHSHFDW